MYRNICVKQQSLYVCIYDSLGVFICLYVCIYIYNSMLCTGFWAGGKIGERLFCINNLIQSINRSVRLQTKQLGKNIK